MSLRLEGFGEESLGTKGKQKKKGSRANGGRGGGDHIPAPLVSDRLKSYTECRCSRTRAMLRKP